MAAKLRKSCLALIGLSAALLTAALPEEAWARPRRLALGHAQLAVIITDDLFGWRSKLDFEARRHGQKFRLRFIGRAPRDLVSGQRVSFAGLRLRAHTVLLSARPDRFLAEDGPAPGPLSEVRQVIVLRIQSTSAVSSATVEQLAAIMQTMDAWYLESSFQQLSTKNDRNGDGRPDIYTVTVNQSTAGLADGYKFSLCSTAQSNAAAQFGVTPAEWDHVICILPPDMAVSSGWFGSAYIGWGETVINGSHAGSYPGGYTHEIGHNLGMHHASSPSGGEYGDSSCVMGGNAATGRRHFHGPHKVQMGWLPSAAASAGVHELSAAELDPAARPSEKSVLKIHDAVSQQDLYVSYRAPSGSFSASLNIPYRTSVHRGYSQTYLLAALNDGESYSQNGITIQQLAHTAASATVRIDAPCTAIAPEVSIAPAARSVNRPLAQQYTITVTNRDTSCVSAVEFTLSSTTPGAGWNVALDVTRLSLTPGQSGTAVLTATPPGGLPAGYYYLTVSAKASGHPSGDRNAAYVLDLTAPARVTNLAVRQ